MPIRILPENVSSAIAAGEVVERPASVVKELVENSLDAGAKSIQITTEEGGKLLIEVVDDGCGIAQAEVLLAVARFATSKLETAQDLFAIDTLGFRGEALSSIAAVSRLEMVTRVQGEEIGSKLNVNGGEIKPLSSIGSPPGTVIRIRDLFYNVPARRKFLKTENTERRWITRFVSRYALAYPEVRFQLQKEGRSLFNTSGNGDQREVLTEVFGLETARQMISIPPSPSAEISVSGFVSPPELNRSNRRELTFFVNGRWVQDSSLSAAVLQAYHTLLMVGRYPLAVLFLQVPPEQVDVNVHPTKSEIRFRESDRVFAVLQRAIRATLMGHTSPPRVDLHSTWSREGLSSRPGAISTDWGFAAESSFDPSASRPLSLQGVLPAGTIPLLRAVGQIGAAYLVAEGPDGLYLVDQHAAHERILFEKMMAARDAGALESQNLLEAQTIEFSHSEAVLLQENLKALNELGFVIEPFGERSFRLRAVPSLVMGKDPSFALRSVVEEFEENEEPLADALEARLAARICKRVAIKAGQVLSLAEQRQLLRDLEACSMPRTCPHGRPTMIHLSVDALERQFGRR
ncbi:MAG: DNA mismatch repair endonuclease MutL [Anaerolineales bacterium]|nr:MAG: DNA mismatch repair endonuclease MutL [Anaerolineales bacterium]